MIRLYVLDAGGELLALHEVPSHLLVDGRLVRSRALVQWASVQIADAVLFAPFHDSTGGQFEAMLIESRDEGGGLFVAECARKGVDIAAVQYGRVLWHNRRRRVRQAAPLHPERN